MLGQPRPQGLSLKKWENPWGRGCMLGMFRGSVTMLGKSPKGLSRQQGTGMQAAILREGPREFDA